MTKPFDKDAWILRALKCGAYIVTPEGQVSRVVRRKNRIGGIHTELSPLKVHIHKKNQRRFVQMTFEGVTKSVLLNRIVALAYVPNPLNLPEVNHKDGEKGHNWASNLEWSDRSDQETHAFETGLKTSRGSGNPGSKLTAAQVVEIRTAWDIRQSAIAVVDQKTWIANMAESYAVSASTVRDIVNRRTWSHV